MDTEQLPRQLFEEAKAIFFEAMCVGYAAGAEASPVPGFPGSKNIEYRRDSWLVTDTYFVRPHDIRSGGQTIIYYAESPVWMMQYLGEYPPQVLPFLKEALFKNYSQSVWDGGRGPTQYPLFARSAYPFNYVNLGSRNFHKFSGKEWISNHDGVQLGWHAYNGLWLPNR